MGRFQSILIANRGEIACRIIRSAKALGYRTVAVYSQADMGAPHTKLADEAHCIGPAPVASSYLDMDKIVEAARQTGAGAVHPGYGFLSENAGFADACEAAGLVFIGPPPAAIRSMGNKAEAKRHMAKAGVPCVPGYEGQDQSDQTLSAEAVKIGFPLMVKAAAGGGGRGMRLVTDKKELSSALGLARSEAESAFGSGELILERAIQRPRHVEVQVFADAHGGIVHLGERDCSVQRRHQKVIEEAPCPVMTETLRNEMGQAAIEAARAIDYRGAGTVEFLLDEQGAFYFLEMNTRLQVEHPVTELITGQDLVALQIKVAQGEPLGFGQKDVDLKGHAIEVRLYAEDPSQDFLPMTGPVELWQPAMGEGVRIDSGIETGSTVSPFYDAMLAKIIAYGPTREDARARLVEALKGTTLFGTQTNKAFLIECLGKNDFAQGQATTAFIDEAFAADGISPATPGFEEAALAAAVDVTLAADRARADSVCVSPELTGWTSAGQLVTRKHYQFDGADFDLSVFPLERAGYKVSGGGEETVIRAELTGASSATVTAGDRRHAVIFHQTEEASLYVSVDGREALYTDLIRLAGVQEEEAGGGHITAPMHGLLLEVFVAPGDVVKRGQRLAILEAMKMQHEITAAADGTVIDVKAEAGAQVPADALLIEIDVVQEEEAP